MESIWVKYEITEVALGEDYRCLMGDEEEDFLK